MPKAFVVNQEYLADTKVFAVSQEYLAGMKIFIVDQEYLADMKVFFVSQEYLADVKVFIVSSEYLLSGHSGYGRSTQQETLFSLIFIMLVRFVPALAGIIILLMNFRGGNYFIIGLGVILIGWGVELMGGELSDTYNYSTQGKAMEKIGRAIMMVTYFWWVLLIVLFMINSMK